MVKNQLIVYISYIYCKLKTWLNQNTKLSAGTHNVLEVNVYYDPKFCFNDKNVFC